VTWGTPVQSFVFLGLLVFELEPMYATSDRRTDGRRSTLNAPRRGHNNIQRHEATRGLCATAERLVDRETACFTTDLLQLSRMFTSSFQVTTTN